MKVHVFYNGWIASDHKSFTLGGVQTYLLNLSIVFREMGYEFHYYRGSDIDNEIIIQKVNVHEMAWRGKSHSIKNVFNHYKHLIDKKEDIVLFADDYLSTSALEYHSLSIQHGVFWDIPMNRKLSPIKYFYYFLKKMRNAWIRMSHIRNVKYVVCVDYNFVNWFRAVFPYTINSFRVIPNFAPICEKVVKPSDKINIIFARRFELFRGTRVFGEAIKRILKERKDVFVTIAGWGSDENWLHKQLDCFENVRFTEYQSSDSLNIHKDKHIAVIPTIGSEGTSLSMLEAMSAQCAVVVSDVGGMTNIIIDGYNGRIIPAGDSDKLYEVLNSLITNPGKIKQYSEKAYDTILNSLSYERWKNDWKQVIEVVKEL